MTKKLQQFTENQTNIYIGNLAFRENNKKVGCI